MVDFTAISLGHHLIPLSTVARRTQGAQLTLLQVEAARPPYSSLAQNRQGGAMQSVSVPKNLAGG
jgi:hypothetical protein